MNIKVKILIGVCLSLCIITGILSLGKLKSEWNLVVKETTTSIKNDVLKDNDALQDNNETQPRILVHKMEARF